MSAAPSIAVVVPVLNEEAAIGALLERLRPHSPDCEIVFVDGGSTDATRDIVAAEFRVIEAPRGRAGSSTRVRGRRGPMRCSSFTPTAHPRRLPRRDTRCSDDG